MDNALFVYTFKDILGLILLGLVILGWMIYGIITMITKIIRKIRK